MKELVSQLAELPEEFKYAMEEHHDNRWPNIYEYIVNLFYAEDLIDNLESRGQPIKNFLKYFYDMGFYAGVNFALDPQEDYDPNEETIF